MTSNRLAVIDQQRSVLGSSSLPRAYTPYGAVSDKRGAVLAYCGQARDSLTGHYHLGNGHRTFNPLLMRFSSPDRLSPFAVGGLNVYAYCMGDPVNRNDPTGRVATLNVALYTAGGYASGKLHEHLLTLWNMFSYNVDRAKALTLDPAAARDLPALSKRDVGQAVLGAVTSTVAFAVAAGGTYNELQMSAKAVDIIPAAPGVSDPVGEIVLPVLNLLTAGASKMSDAMAGDLSGKYKELARKGSEKVEELNARRASIRQPDGAPQGGRGSRASALTTSSV
ncbi:RHS repeat-associated core domain-containing protein [Pseudomonas mosselii]|uniref:RHS repeat-associated core domain-containing protein n=1 Tax=Pseudomonas mosselii TaxID=78327 RepID=UPI0009BFAA35|nr:RHS repeat-associated core domain-containing protein [Pseudomonas mosselii]MDH1655898.1 RHS repeat-associated core domain-containing protein [Pseudomonas mosselii]MDH1715559.1 RHS repeat-associated core domain-containing protein [Pseudomonas mosselii]MDH1720250.1 RHS repeat-associated core domain-containing protein [Pseudomonas mosselii]